ncbi:MAG: carbohydrate-binding protein, partial [Bacteroidetes bacterium]
SEGLGWAWWPLKKVESISCPLSVPKPAGYQQLLDYWGGSGPAPTAAEAKDALMALAENLKTEHCVFQPDVIDAMFRQVYDSTTVPYRTFHLPGPLQPTDFDMGLVGIAYYDTDVANYHVSTGNYTAWNQGWAYRNDGVDIEKTGDPLNDHGYHLAWTEEGEWMQYDVVVDQGGLYDIDIRVASATGGGVIHLEADGTDLTGFRYLPNTGGWQLWQTYTISNVVLDAGPQKLRLYIDGAGNNIGPMEFSYQGPATSVNARFVSAVTHDEHTIRLTLSKALAAPLPPAPAGFSLYDDGVAVPVTGVVQDADHPRVLWLTTSHAFTFEDEINVSYDDAAGLVATDGTPLSGFLFRIVTNTLPVLLEIPGRIEAEAFFRQSGIQTEPTTDAGGGLNIGFLDPGDYADYYVRVAEAGLYRVDYRTASESATGGLALQLIDDEADPQVLHTVTFAPTGGWQTWATTSAEALLPQGIHRLRIFITQPSYNLNWMDFTLLSTDTREARAADAIHLYPNPATTAAWLEAEDAPAALVRLSVHDLLGRQVWQQGAPFGKRFRVELPLHRLGTGTWLVRLYFADGTTTIKKLVVME